MRTRLTLLLLALALALPPLARADERRERAGHLLRRAGFGGTPQEVSWVVRYGPLAWISRQLEPATIDDSGLLPRLPRPLGPQDEATRQERWYVRMAYSKRQLLEKMTLVWHEHFATSNEKVQDGLLMEKQEALFRRRALGSFGPLLADVTRDQAMLRFLDNDRNDGSKVVGGVRVPPNANYARELLQLFSTGPHRLHLDGTPVVDENGRPLPAYTEDDVREVARALTGWRSDPLGLGARGVFDYWRHDPGDKLVMGSVIRGRAGDGGRYEVEDVVAIIMRQPSTAPFISKMLIQKLATETPAPAYVERVARVFRSTNGNLKATVRAVLVDPDFMSPAAVRSMHKTPIEHLVGMVRSLDGHTDGKALREWTGQARHLVYRPPSVFSFYAPGHRAQLVNAALLTARDQAAHAFASGATGTSFDPEALVRKHAIRTPEQAVDVLADRLLQAPLDPAVRQEIVAAMEGRIDAVKIRSAAFLVLVSPDFQRN